MSQFLADAGFGAVSIFCDDTFSECVELVTRAGLAHSGEQHALAFVLTKFRAVFGAQCLTLPFNQLAPPFGFTGISTIFLFEGFTCSPGGVAIPVKSAARRGFTVGVGLRDAKSLILFTVSSPATVNARGTLLVTDRLTTLGGSFAQAEPFTRVLALVVFFTTTHCCIFTTITQASTFRRPRALKVFIAIIDVRRRDWFGSPDWSRCFDRL